MTPAELVLDAPLAHLRWGRVESGGRLAVLLHGVGGSRESWGDALSGTGRAIADAGWCAVAVDLPGYGHSASVEPYVMASLAGRVGALLAWLRRESLRVALVGHSLGGMVAQELLARDPAAADVLVLLATSPAFGKPGGDWQRQYLSQRLAPLDEGRGMGAIAPGLVKGIASANASHDIVARAALLMSAVPEATYRSALQALVGFDRRAALGQIGVPTLCLAGEDDRNAPPALMQQMAARIPGAQYQVLPGVGHLAHMESPDEVNAAIVAFLKNNA